MKDFIEGLIGFIFFAMFVAIVWMWLSNPEPLGTIKITF